MSPAEIARPKALLRKLFRLHCENIRSSAPYSLWPDKAKYRWLSGRLLNTLVSTEEKEDEASNRDLAAFVGILNEDSRVVMLLEDSSIAALLNAFFSYFPEYVLQLRSSVFVEKLVLDFSWVNECVIGLINQYLEQIHADDDAIREIACTALGSAAPLLTQAQLAFVIDEMLIMSEKRNEKGWIRIYAYKTLAEATRYVDEPKKSDVIQILSARATRSEAIIQHYSILEALGIIANTASRENKIEVTNLFTHLCTNANRDVRQAASTARNIVCPNSNKEPPPRRLSASHIDLSLADSEFIQAQAVKMQYAKRIALIRKFALNLHGEAIPHWDFDAIAHIYHLNEVQHTLQERESRAFIEPITQIIAEYCAPTPS